jgi:phage tail-like protein
MTRTPRSCPSARLSRPECLIFRALTAARAGASIVTGEAIAMSVQRDRPYPDSNFLVDLGDGDPNTLQAGLIEVVLPDARVQVVEYRNGNDKGNDPHKLTTQTEYTNLILKRATHGSLSWYVWWNEVRNGGQASFRTVTVQLLNEDHSQTVLAWKFLRARPVSHRFAPLIGHDNAALIETLELAFERLEME